MNRQDASLGWYQHSHGSDFSLDKDDIRVLIQWGGTFSDDGAAEKDLIKSGLKNLPLSLTDASAEGKAASQVLQKMLSQSLTTFEVEDAEGLAFFDFAGPVVASGDDVAVEGVGWVEGAFF